MDYLPPETTQGSQALRNNIMRKCLPELDMKFLANIYNKSLELNYFPTH
jgi:hypothetical protein